MEQLVCFQSSLDDKVDHLKYTLRSEKQRMFQVPERKCLSQFNYKERAFAYPEQLSMTALHLEL